MTLYLGRPKSFGQQRGGSAMCVVIDADSEMGLGFLSDSGKRCGTEP